MDELIKEVNDLGYWVEVNANPGQPIFCNAYTSPKGDGEQSRVAYVTGKTLEGALKALVKEVKQPSLRLKGVS